MKKPATPFRDQPTLTPRAKPSTPRDLTMEQLSHAAQQIQRRAVRWANEDLQRGRNTDPLFS